MVNDRVSAEYDPIHPPNAITDNLPPEKQYVYSARNRSLHADLCGASLGPVDLDTVVKADVVVTDEEKAREERMAQRPSLTEILNLHDFEV